MVVDSQTVTRRWRDIRARYRSASIGHAGNDGAILAAARTRVNGIRTEIARSVAMRVTGHKTEAIYKRYAIVNERDMAEGLAKLNDLPTTPSKVASIGGNKS